MMIWGNTRLQHAYSHAVPFKSLVAFKISAAIVLILTLTLLSDATFFLNILNTVVWMAQNFSQWPQQVRPPEMLNSTHCCSYWKTMPITIGALYQKICVFDFCDRKCALLCISKYLLWCHLLQKELCTFQICSQSAFLDGSSYFQAPGWKCLTLISICFYYNSKEGGLRPPSISPCGAGVLAPDCRGPSAPSSQSLRNSYKVGHYCVYPVTMC